MGEDREEEVAGASPIPTMDYASRAKACFRHTGLAARLIAEAVFAIGAALSFRAAFLFYIPLENRRIPSSLRPLYGSVAGCVIFSIGLIHTMSRGRTTRVWDRWVWLFLLAGVAAALIGLDEGITWR